MATQYTQILKLALPVTGELDGTWGETVNDEITSMVEQAVAGLATINSWTANSHTLTVVDGASSESRCAILVLDDDGSGNPSAAATVICPDESKTYIVKNISGQTVTVKTAAGTGVAIPNNTSVSVFCDGTNVNAVSTFSASFTADIVTANTEVRLNDDDASNYVALQAPSSVASNLTFTLPGTDGAANQFLQTNGSGVLSFGTLNPTVPVTTKSSNYTALLTDQGALIVGTGTWTLSLSAAAGLGNGWYIFLQNTGTGTITVDPNASETIGGATTATCNPGDIWLIVCNGTNFNLLRIAGLNYQIFSSSGTFTVPAGVERIYVECWGGGGGGSRGLQNSFSGSGAGGGYSAGWLNVTPGDSITATVGTGGAAAAAANSLGSAGGTTTFSSLSASGGGAGVANWFDGGLASAGTGSGGDININGSPNKESVFDSTNRRQVLSGGNAARGAFGSAQGSNSLGGTTTVVSTYTSSAPGAGGYGGDGYSVTASAGTAGQIIVYWI